MSSLDNLRNEFREFLLSWIELHAPGYVEIIYSGFALLWLIVFAIALHLFLHKFVRGILVRLANKRGQRIHRALLANNLFRRLSYVLQGIVVHDQAALWMDETSLLLKLIEIVSDQWILLFGLLSFFAILNAIQSVMYQRPASTRFPLRGLIQTIKLLSSVVIGLIAVSVLMDKSPLILLSSLGALSAVILLIFKDPILGLVAGIQLSANEMLSVGDWLEMPKYGADGDVIDIALTTVKIRNWDKTITTIPTYALISDSFKNWRGMSEAGGRRIKRSILIETSTIKFLDEELLQHLKKSELLHTYLEEKMNTIKDANEQQSMDLSVQINGRRLTNVGTLRGYLVSYLEAHPGIHQDMTLLVRQLDPTSEGLPIQIYAFTNTTNWNAYEDIQSDIFDHLLSVLPEFQLRAHESPTGHDVRSLTCKQSKD